MALEAAPAILFGVMIDGNNTFTNTPTRSTTPLSRKNMEKMHTPSLYGVINVRMALDALQMYHIRRKHAPILHCLSIVGTYHLRGTLTVIIGTSKVVLS